MTADQQDAQKIVHFSLEDEALLARNPDVEHERRVAIFDLLEENSFVPKDCPIGPYRVSLAVTEKGIVLNVRNSQDEDVKIIDVSLMTFRRIIKDYFLICENYYEAIRSSSLDKIEAIDQGRRALHNEGSQILQEKLSVSVAVDFDTARRLFTLICVLQMRG